MYIHSLAMSTLQDMSDARNCCCLAARRRARALTRLYEEYLRPIGLRATQFSILAALHLKGPSATSELADLLGLERTTLTRSAAVMKRNGWIESSPAEDARLRTLQLTTRGRKKLDTAFPAWQQAQQAALNTLAGEGGPAS